MRKALLIGLKDLLVMVRDLPAIAVMLGMPMVLILILGSALGGIGAAEGGMGTVVVVNQDGGAVGDRLADAFTTDEELSDLFHAELRDDLEAVRSEVERGDLAAALVIPEGLSERLEDGERVELLVLADPGQALSSSVFRSVVDAIGTRISAGAVAAQTTKDVLVEANLLTGEEQARRLIDDAVEAATAEDALSAVTVAEAEAKGESSFAALSYYAGGMSIMFLLFGAMFGAFSLVTERSEQTLPRLLTTPTARAAVVGGKMFGVFVIAALQFSVLYAFTRVMGVDWGPSVLGLVVLIGATILAVTGLGVLLSSLGTTRRAVGAIAPIVIQIQAAAGGSFFPVEVLPKWLQPIHYATINGWAIDGVQSLQRGAAASAILPNAAALTVMGALFFLAGIVRLRAE